MKKNPFPAGRLLPCAAAIAAALILLSACSARQEKAAPGIAVFVPGIIEDSPVYDMLVQGVRAAVDAYNETESAKDRAPVELSVLEAGTNQAEWGNKLTALAASGKYGVIVSSNPSLPEIAAPLTAQFPDQRFIILDAFYEGNDRIATVRYNQREQAYLTGYIAALISAAPASEMRFANAARKIGFIAAQEYPVMNTILLPSFTEGAQAAVPGMEVDFRVVGNWYDASKGAELAKALYKSGADVVLPICGGASQGVIAAAKELGFYITWFDDNGFAKAPGYIVSSSVMAQKRMAQEVTAAYLDGTVEFGSARTVGIEDGYIDFEQNDPQYVETVSEPIRTRMAAVVDQIKSGALLLPSP